MHRLFQLQLVLALMLSGNLAAQSTTGAPHVYSFNASSLLVMLDSSIKEPQRWEAIISADTTFSNYFLQRSFTTVVVSSIKQTGAGQYDFRIRAVPAAGGAALLPAATGNVHYAVKLCPGLRERPLICSIQSSYGEL